MEWVFDYLHLDEQSNTRLSCPYVHKYVWTVCFFQVFHQRHASNSTTSMPLMEQLSLPAMLEAEPLRAKLITQYPQATPVLPREL